MGAMCVSEQEKQMQRERVLKIKQQSKENEEKRNNNAYALKVKKYTQLYGREVSAETKQFIEKNYSYHYSSETRGLGYPQKGELKMTSKSGLVQVFEKAHKNRNTTNSLYIAEFDERNRTLKYNWQVRTPAKIVYYRCIAYFDQEDKFSRAIFDEEYEPVDLKQFIRTYVPPPQPKKEFVFQESSSNNYYGPKPTDWEAHYRAEVARSNQQFAANMNKQAQQWNNYVTQKANRGW